MMTNEIRKEPCSTCPYRTDVPAGIWAFETYEMLRPYDAPTGEQPYAPFGCHSTPSQYCHGWAVTHNSRGHAFELLALRLHAPEAEIPKSEVIFFGSGNEAADHGQAELEEPSIEARLAVEKLQRRHARLR
jgi:uncharacterized protein DUF6283